MSKDKPSAPFHSLQSMHEPLEMLHSHLIDLEAVAHAAEQCLENLPYLPRGPQSQQQPDPELQRSLGRLQVLVASTASAARSVLQEMEYIMAFSVTRTRSGTGNGNGSSRAREPRRPFFYGPERISQPAAVPDLPLPNDKIR